MQVSENKTDEEIIMLIIEGDSELYGEIMQRYENRLLRYVVYLIHDEDAAADVVQETFIKAYKNLQSFKKKYKFSSWIYRIAHNEAMNAVKKDVHIVHSVDIDESQEASYEPTTIQDIDRAILQEDVKSCLDELQLRYREVLMLQYYENMKYNEIADVLHVPSSTVGVWASRGKAMLKQVCIKKGAKV